jgi:hypothetical protein
LCPGFRGTTNGLSDESDRLRELVERRPTAGSGFQDLEFAESDGCLQGLVDGVLGAGVEGAQ